MFNKMETPLTKFVLFLVPKLAVPLPPPSSEDFDDKQNNTDDFDEERIDKQRYAKKQEEAVNPGGPGMNNDQPAHPGGQLLRYRFTNLEQQFTQPPSSHFKATVLQVLKPKRVRQDIITVKPHQRIEVHCK